MKFSNIRLSSKTQNTFGRLKNPTGLTPNLLARYAICLSIKEKSTPNFEEFGNDEGSMIEPSILFGEYEKIFLALMKNRMKKDSIPDSKLNETTRLHINRGAFILNKIINDIGDFAELINEKRNV